MKFSERPRNERHIDESGRVRLTGEFDATRIEASRRVRRRVRALLGVWTAGHATGPGRVRCCSAVRRVAHARRRASSNAVLSASASRFLYG